ncbi:hypothetical protein [Planococcus sp. CAU13]|uniref:hypothetical protein n=1 Tax=Planococcus sp. CAU13 TaxID=1541197 RepID=UPI00052FF232|nr:hypothetical protein [Planococcus sp. CAU13]
MEGLIIIVVGALAAFLAIMYAINGNKAPKRSLPPLQNIIDANREYLWLTEARETIEQEYKSGQIDEDTYIDRVVDFAAQSYSIQQSYGISPEEATRLWEMVGPSTGESIK